MALIHSLSRVRDDILTRNDGHKCSKKKRRAEREKMKNKRGRERRKKGIESHLEHGDDSAENRLVKIKIFAMV
jgi:hypothetical protein